MAFPPGPVGITALWWRSWTSVSPQFYELECQINSTSDYALQRHGSEVDQNAKFTDL